MFKNSEINITASLIVIFLGFTFLPFHIQEENVGGKELNEKISVFRPVIDSLLDMGIDSAFIYSLVIDNRTKFNEKYVKINVTGYLKKPDYSSNYNITSEKKSKKFYKKYKTLLRTVEDIYGVPGNVITAILWVETKFGAYTGRHHIASVYLSTALANRYEFIQMNLRELKKNENIDSTKLYSLQNKVYERVEKKSLWAKEQLLYLDSARLRLPNSILELKGSWAGAFGLSQFIPSSYVRWAVDGNEDGKINLFDLEDAVFSIGNYLKSNGWSDNIEDKRKAVHHYNNSDDYVNAVLKLASRI